MVTRTSDEQAQTDESVADNHDGRENRIARHGSSFRTAGQHDRDDQGNFDDGYGQREHQGAEGFAHSMRHDLGVVHGADHVADESEQAYNGQQGVHRQGEGAEEGEAAAGGEAAEGGESGGGDAEG